MFENMERICLPPNTKQLIQKQEVIGGNGWRRIIPVYPASG